jgi:hypothetical protein
MLDLFRHSFAYSLFDSRTARHATAYTCASIIPNDRSKSAVFTEEHRQYSNLDVKEISASS